MTENTPCCARLTGGDGEDIASWVPSRVCAVFAFVTPEIMEMERKFPRRLECMPPECLDLGGGVFLRESGAFMRSTGTAGSCDGTHRRAVTRVALPALPFSLLLWPSPGWASVRFSV